jgi:acetyl-CoA carboxylase carboxyl transferase subunit beta
MAATRTAPDWLACRHCRTLVYGKRFARDLCVCPECGHHARLGAWERLRCLLDPESLTPLHAEPVPDDPLDFTDLRPYPERLREARATTGLDDAVVGVRGAIGGRGVVAAAMDFAFMGGSMGTAVGERIAAVAETALTDRLPLVLITASGGARMQEGILALLQMVKTSAALAELDQAGILTISVITDPTYAGVAASFATLTDVIIAEPGARMGFAGPRVIQQTIDQTLPPGFQTAESLLDHGLIDDIRPRTELRATLHRLLGVSERPTGARVAVPAETLIHRAEELPGREAWAAVQHARDVNRPTTLDYLAHIADDFHELHGDRMSGDCPAIVGGIATLHGCTAVVIGHQKGHTTAELVARNFGMPTPDGYRKAARLLRMAAKLQLPVVTFVDTPGAFPGVAAEEGGQTIAIAENIRLMVTLPTPVVSVVTGEGGSGGALALCVADRVLCLSGSVYSVISPEGCAAILWRDRSKAADAAAALRLDARELLSLGVVDAVIPEPAGGAQAHPVLAAERLRDALSATLHELTTRPVSELLKLRRERYRHSGVQNGRQR